MRHRARGSLFSLSRWERIVNSISRTNSVQYVICTSGTRPSSPVSGTMIFETDTNTMRFYTGTSWQNVGAALGALDALSAKSAPPGWLFSYGQAVSRTSHDLLFGALVPLMGNPTISIASPGVVTLNGHGLSDGDAVYLTTSGGLPTGLSQNTLYYAKSPAANTFQLSATRSATTGLAGTAINTSGSQSGTHSCYFCPYGLGDGSTTFNVPDMRGRVPAGLDNIGGADAARLSVANAVGFASGGETHTLTTTEIPSHTHGFGVYVRDAGTTPTNPGTVIGQIHVGNESATAVYSGETSGAGGGSSHNNMQPYVLMNWIIKV